MLLDLVLGTPLLIFTLLHMKCYLKSILRENHVGLLASSSFEAHFLDAFSFHAFEC